MRISPKSLSPAEALAKVKAKAQTRDDERRETLESEAAEAAANVTSPAEIDASRAQRLLERASSLAARGDMSAAVLATRQSLALAPDRVKGHLLHADLLERNRDFGGARAAYEKSVQLAPDRADARANLARLDAFLEKSQGAARQFHFDADELFAPDSEEKGAQNPQSALVADNAPAATPVIVAPLGEAPLGAEPQEKPLESSEPTAMFDQSMLPSFEARLPPTRNELLTPASSNEESGKKAPAESAFMSQQNIENSDSASVGERRKHNIPVATERRRRPAAGAAIPLAAPVAAVAAPVAAVAAPVAAVAAPVAAVAAPVAAVAARVAGAAPLTAANLKSPSARITDNSFGDATALRASAPARAPLALDIPTAPAGPLWQQVVSRPSFYARTLPLVAVALLSLGFLSWARGRAVSKVVTPTSTELASADVMAMPDAPATVPGTTLPVPNNQVQTNAAPTNDAAGFPISNAPAVFQAPPASGAGTATASGPSANGAPARANGGSASTPARANNRGPNSSSNARTNRILPPARPVPNFPGVSLAPAPIPPSSVRNASPSSSSQGNGGSSIILPSPSIEMPVAPAPRQRVLPPTDSGLNPAGSPNRGYVRVTEGRVGNGVIPSQPSAVARDNERQANDAARNGQSDQAISQLSQAIRADSNNAGFRYQQRATLFLQRGDYNRATDDFQSAISAYQSQISRGDDVAQARRGLSSARSGLNLALAGKR